MKAIETTIDLPLADTEVVVQAALEDQGFGVLTEIDVTATLKDKLGVDRAPLKILGACNPDFAYRATMLPSWKGCGAPVEHVLGDVPPADRCQCKSDPRAEGRLWASR